MIGMTNAVVGGGGSATSMEKVNLTLTSNQSSADDLLGATITLAYGEYSETFTWEGQTLTFDITTYITYSIVFGSVSGYKAPDTIVFVAMSGNVRQIDAQYQAELVTVSVSTDNGLYLEGSSFTIDGSLYFTDGVVTTVSQKVPYGTTYSISVETFNGYNAPITKTFTASQVTRSVSMVYEEVKLGVFIQDTTGRLWTSDAWDGSVTANGVAVLTSACEFVIALSEEQYYDISTVGYSSSMDLPIYSTSDAAIMDYSGRSNTTAIVSAYGDSWSSAAGYCANYIFPNGKKGYLGSAGEWQAAYDNKSAVVECVLTVGGGIFRNASTYWSSSRVVDSDKYNRFWFLRWGDGSWDNSNANSLVDFYARPFAPI